MSRVEAKGTGMAQVSLIIAGSEPDEAWIAQCRAELKGAGHQSEVFLASSTVTVRPAVGKPDSRRVFAKEPGLAPAAVAGLLKARGAILVVVDGHAGYGIEDLLSVIAELEAGAAEIVVASRPTRFARLYHALTGSTDPRSGLIGLTRAALDTAETDLHPVGSQFSLELLGKTRGRRRDVPVSARPMAARRRLGWDEFRHVKRLADHRFGNLSRLIQFCAVGASGMVVDLTSYAAFQWLFKRTTLAGMRWPVLGPLDLAAAAVLAVLLALTWNFALNRRMTFSDVRSGSIIKQYLTYALSSALAISLNLALRLTLPRYVGFFDQHKLAAAVVGIVLATGVSFSMARWVVFRRRPAVHAPRPARSDAPWAESTVASS